MSKKKRLPATGHGPVVKAGPAKKGHGRPSKVSQKVHKNPIPAVGPPLLQASPRPACNSHWFPHGRCPADYPSFFAFPPRGSLAYKEDPQWGRRSLGATDRLYSAGQLPHFTPSSPTRTRPSILDSSNSTRGYVNDRERAHPLPLRTPSLPRQHLLGHDADFNEWWEAVTPSTGWWYNVELPTRRWWKRRLPRYVDPFGVEDPYLSTAVTSTECGNARPLPRPEPPADIPDAVYLGRDEGGNAVWAARDRPAGNIHLLRSAMERKWGMQLCADGKLTYRIGSDVHGRPKYKLVQHYEAGITEQLYGIGAARRLRVRAPDEKGIAEVLVGYDLHDEEDWRPMYMPDYQGPFEAPVPC